MEMGSFACQQQQQQNNQTFTLYAHNERNKAVNFSLRNTQMYIITYKN